MKVKVIASGVNMDELVGNTDQFADSGYVHAHFKSAVLAPDCPWLA